MRREDMRCEDMRCEDMRREEGQVVVETLLALLVLVLLVFGAFEFARAISIKQALDVGTYNAARHLSLDPGDLGAAEMLIHDELANSVLGQDYADSFTWSVDGGGGGFGDLLTVRAEVNFAFDVPLLSLGGVNLRVQHSQPIERYP